MHQRPANHEYHPFYETYIRLVPEGNLHKIFRQQLKDTTALLSSVSESQGNYRYADGKWSLKEVVGHVTDNERIMSYRLLMIARGMSTPLPGYQQDELIGGAVFHSASMSQIIADYTAVRHATLTLLSGIPDEAWTRTGNVSNHEASARAVACMLAGHELHHVNILRNKYI